jgi:hypothetical protein
LERVPWLGFALEEMVGKVFRRALRQIGEQTSGTLDAR